MQIENIGIIGQGFVGTAVREGMRPYFKIFTYDLKEPEDLVVYDKKDVSRMPASDRITQLVRETDGPIFVCLPTPMKTDGSCDISIVESVVREINDCHDGPKPRIVVLKSTVIPGTTDYLNQTYNTVQVCYNPEFLTARMADEDFKNQQRVIVGGPLEATNVVKQIYAKAFPNVPVTKTSGTIAEMVKYVTNCFLATKVSLANEFKQICDGLDIDFDKVIEYARLDKRLGISHWDVPGPDGLLGYGGQCFCKDLNALMCLAREMKVDPKVMQGCWEKNLEVREISWEMEEKLNC
jgi:UDPglucose 6-dehydrogenase